jgi:hypothetical protein
MLGQPVKNCFLLETDREKSMNYAAKKSVFSVCSLLMLLALGLLVSHFYPTTNVAATPGVSPEMERLQRFYLGTWDYTETYPNGGVNTGVYTSEVGPGGIR